MEEIPMQQIRKLLQFPFAASTIIALALGFTAMSSAHAADEFATKKDAQAVVEKAIKAVKTDRNGTVDAINAKDKAWIDRDLYPVMYDDTGTVVAHGQNSKMVGKNLIDLKDPSGKEFVRERVSKAKENPSGFWQEYAFTDPVSKQVKPKEMYCKTADPKTIVCAGVYKR